MTAADDHGNNPSTLDLIAIRGTAWAAAEIERLQKQVTRLQGVVGHAAFDLDCVINSAEGIARAAKIAASDARNALETSHD